MVRFYSTTLGFKVGAHTLRATVDVVSSFLFKSAKILEPPADPSPAYFLEVRGERFELGEPLSSAAAFNLEAPLGLLKKLYSSTNPPEWKPFINHEHALP